MHRYPARVPPQLRDWAELDKLAALPALREVLFAGNPMYDSVADRAAARLQVLKRLPRLEKIDNQVVTDNDREAASRA
jgi:dynein light chain 1